MAVADTYLAGVKVLADNLLINAIQAQFGKPLKAYVVSRDVTTQQQLDGIIVGQAGT